MENIFDFKSMKADSSIYPDNCFSFTEYALYFSEAAENEFNKLFQNIAEKEITLFESGEELVYEADDESKFSFKKNIIDPILKKIKKLAEWIKGLFEKLMKTIEEKYNGFKANIVDKLKLERSMIKKYKKEISDYLDNKPIEVSYYTFDPKKIYDEFKSNTEKFTDYALKANTDVSEYASSVCSAVVNASVHGKDKLTIEEMKKYIENKYMVTSKVTYADLAADHKNKFNSDMINEILFGSSHKGVIGLAKAWVSAKASCTFIGNKVKKLEASEQGEVIKKAGIGVKLIQAQTAAILKCVQLEMTTFNSAVRVYFTVAKICKKAQNAEKKAVKESVDVLNVVENAFQW